MSKQICLTALMKFPIEQQRRIMKKLLNENEQAEEPASIDYSKLYIFIGKLIAQEDIKSISCPFGGFEVWNVLVTEQVKRSKIMKVPPSEALRLGGPDGILLDDYIDRLKQMGGEIHLPYEGMYDGDVIFLPYWRRFQADKANEGGSLSKGLNLQRCKYLFVPPDRDLGELTCATRQLIMGWSFYADKK